MKILTNPKSTLAFWAILVVIIVLTGGCATATTPANPEVKAEATPSASLFDEAHRCEGVVRYEAEMQRGEMRSRLSCEWTVEPDEWGAW